MEPISRDMNSLLSDLEVAALLGIGRSTVWAWAKDGRLPSPIRNGRVTRWRYADVVAKAVQKGEAA